MDARKTLGWALALGMALLTLGADPSTARADEATARLHDGGVVSGTIEVYEPGRRVVLRTASGEVVTLTHDQIAELHITPSQPGVTALTAPPPSPPPSTYAPPPHGESFQPAPSAREFQTTPVGPGGQSVYVVQPAPAYPQPYQPRLGLPSLAAPFLMMAAGATLIGVGVRVASSCSDWDYDDCDRRDNIGLALVTSGAAMAFVGLVVLLPIQMGKRARRRAAYPRQVAISPSLDLAGGRYGVAGTLRF